MTHGSFCDNAFISQMLKTVAHEPKHWNGLSAVQKEAIDMICCKLSRILSGQGSFQDHWLDIAGYAQLVVREIKEGRY
jgi:hypothetical protein